MDPVSDERDRTGLVSDERGQALIVSVLVLAIAAAAITGLRAAQERIISEAQMRRAGEAAVEAATAVIADAYVTALASRPPGGIALALTSAQARSDARAAALAMSVANGGGDFDGPDVRCGDRGVEVTITVGGRTYRAGFAATCSPH